jgi:hypothetical protein
MWKEPAKLEGAGEIQHLWITEAEIEHGLEDFEEGDCKAMHEWQVKFFSNCNNIHESDFCPIHTSRQEGGVMFGGLTNSTTNHMLLRLYDGKIKNLDFEMQRVIAEM